MEIVTGKAGVPHVSSADDGRRIAGEVGTGSYVLQTGGKLAPSLVDANTVRIATGDMIVQGRHIGVTSPEDVKVASGSQGKKRMDYICVHYIRDVSGSSPTLVETVEWKVLQGTPGSSAAAPSVPKGSILDGDADVTVPICSVTFDGLTTGQPKLLIPELTPLADLGDSVSHVVRNVTFSANKQYGPFYYDEFDTEIKARNFVLAFPLSGVRFIRQAAPSSAGKQRWMIVQTYKGNVETIPVMFCCF